MLSVFKKTCFKQYILMNVLYLYKLLHNFYKITMWVEKLWYMYLCNDFDFDFFFCFEMQEIQTCV